MKHNLKISLAPKPDSGGIVRCKTVSLRERVLRRLFGDMGRIVVIVPGGSVEAFDRARQRMYKRYERARDLNQSPSEKDLTYSEFYEWLDSATQARDLFLAGKMSEEEALKIIVVP